MVSIKQVNLSFSRCAMYCLDLFGCVLNLTLHINIVYVKVKVLHEESVSQTCNLGPGIYFLL